MIISEVSTGLSVDDRKLEVLRSSILEMGLCNKQNARRTIDKELTEGSKKYLPLYKEENGVLKDTGDEIEIVQ